MSILITNMGVLIPKDMFFQLPNYKKILKELTIKEKQTRRNGGSSYCMPPKVIEAYRMAIYNSIRYVVFPRYFLLRLKEIFPNIEIIDNLDKNEDTLDEHKYIAVKELYEIGRAHV